MHYTINNQDNKKIVVEVKKRFNKTGTAVKEGKKEQYVDETREAKSIALRENLKKVLNKNAEVSSSVATQVKRKFNTFDKQQRNFSKPQQFHKYDGSIQKKQSRFDNKPSGENVSLDQAKFDILNKTLSQKLDPLNKVLQDGKVFSIYKPKKKPFVTRDNQQNKVKRTFGAKPVFDRPLNRQNKPFVKTNVQELKPFHKAFSSSFLSKPTFQDTTRKSSTSTKTKKFIKPDTLEKKQRVRTESDDENEKMTYQIRGTIESVDEVDAIAESSVFGTKKFKSQRKEREKVIRTVRIPFEGISLTSLANAMAVKLKQLKSKLDNLKISYEGVIDPESAFLVVEEMGHIPEILSKEMDIVPAVGNAEDYKLRCPVVTIVGHVDHGKTSLLDALRKTNVVSTESGGITQSIGASQVFLDKEKFVTFIDTPGHEAFTSMRMRGVQITDIVVLVIAADDGIKDQTVEAINHIRVSNVPFIICYTKIDKSGSKIDKIRQDLLRYNIMVESLGGDVLEVGVSAAKKQNLDALLNLLLLQAEMLELKGNDKCMASGVVIESRLDKHRGPIATVLIKNGSLKQADNFIVGSTYGKVRSMSLSNGQTTKVCTPSVPVEIMGINTVPVPGDILIGIESEKKAREVSEYRIALEKKIINKQKEIDILEYFNTEADKKINLILKADFAGSVEAIASAIAKLSYEGVSIEIVSKSNGAVTESDVLLAKTTSSIILAFKVNAPTSVEKLIKENDVQIKRFSIIYELIEYVDGLAKGILAPSEKEEILGKAIIKAVFVKKKIGTIAGCGVEEGIIKLKTKGRVIRDGKEIYTGNIISLKQRADDKKEVPVNQEVGIVIDNFADYRIGDIIESFVIKAIEKEDK
ncbi:MAG: translation initiation factor IF-2 [Alphaproteobacteria bacterium]|nr:MAG: translation initiation factor IF-2 [Alphaproteobacteria bacterium]